MAYSNYIIRKSKQGDRWDEYAYEYYGDCYRYPEIISANPEIGISPFIPADVDIIIPFQDESTNIKNEGLPPWMDFR